MSSQLNRLNRERYTIQVMIEIYCHGHHKNSNQLCADCNDLFTYAIKRIDKCPLLVDKPTCARCPIHCYKRLMREKIRFVMRYSGPRMLVYHPILTILHYWDEITHKLASRSNNKTPT
jgi:hypothetical protein